MKLGILMVLALALLCASEHDIRKRGTTQQDIAAAGEKFFDIIDNVQDNLKLDNLFTSKEGRRKMTKLLGKLASAWTCECSVWFSTCPFFIRQ
jgi:hypothetical protein